MLENNAALKYINMFTKYKQQSESKKGETSQMLIDVFSSKISDMNQSITQTIEKGLEKFSEKIVECFSSIKNSTESQFDLTRSSSRNFDLRSREYSPLNNENDNYHRFHEQTLQDTFNTGSSVNSLTRSISHTESSSQIIQRTNSLNQFNEITNLSQNHSSTFNFQSTPNTILRNDSRHKVKVQALSHL
ncbi:unnamed protein product [Brachionus calyciflorus]|uniref:Uncharacterized protein n=1 Tax=Brachionus calyciflorus TaxID=104777 RepID=A0A814PUH3_9BILA|nr:unnamed protein product [Brachionus calyciflorus]